MARFEIVPSRRYRNIQTNATVSIYGACPWCSESEKSAWVTETVGFSIRGNHTGTIGMGQIPAKIFEEAESRLKKILALFYK